MKEHPLRDLARQVMEVARKHSHWSQAQEIMNNSESHMILLAQYHERIQSSALSSPAPTREEIAAWPWAFPSLACENCSEPVSVDFRYCPCCKATDKITIILPPGDRT